MALSGMTATKKIRHLKLRCFGKMYQYYYSISAASRPLPGMLTLSLIKKALVLLSVSIHVVTVALCLSGVTGLY